MGGCGGVCWTGAGCLLACGVCGGLSGGVGFVAGGVCVCVCL